MLAFFVSAIALLSNGPFMLFGFNNDIAKKGWRVVDDGMMGGRCSKTNVYAAPWHV